MTDQEKPTSRSPYPSRVSLPAAKKPYPSMLDFLEGRFPQMGRELLIERLALGEICTEEGQPISQETPYQPGLELFYYREIVSEIKVPFEEKIIFQNEHLLVACKPHFLPVTPGGKYVNECLLYRLRKKIANDDLVPLHRLDRETAGLVMFSTNKKTRGQYAFMFEAGQIEKEYEAIASLPPDERQTEWHIENRIEQSSNWVVMANVDGKVNARTKIKLVETNGNQARFALEPATGKKHQLRLHLTFIGSQITNDRMYPELLPEVDPDFERPLKLLAKRLSFVDPLSGESRLFESERTLEFD